MLVLIKWASLVVIIAFHQGFSLPILDLSFWDSIWRIGIACSCQEHGDSGFQPIIQRPSGATTNGFFKWKQGKLLVIRSPHLYQNIFRNMTVKLDQASADKNKLFQINLKACRISVIHREQVLCFWHGCLCWTKTPKAITCISRSHWEASKHSASLSGITQNWQDLSVYLYIYL